MKNGSMRSKPLFLLQALPLSPDTCPLKPDTCFSGGSVSNIVDKIKGHFILHLFFESN